MATFSAIYTRTKIKGALEWCSKDLSFELLYIEIRAS